MKKETNILIKLVKGLIKAFALVIAQIAKIIYLIIRWFNNLNAKLFMKLPRLLRVAIIYLLIGLSVFAFEKPRVLVKEVLSSSMIEQIETLENEINIQNNQLTEKDKEIARLNVITKLNDIEKKIYNKSIESELTHEQAILVVAISKHETGNWTSELYKKNNNFGGIYNSKEQKFYSYESNEKGLQAFVNLLKNNYFGQGLDTIEEIGNKYCPVGASNDPTGVNQHWIPKVTQYYNNYLGNK
jgi:hypothetical protein